MTKERLKKIVQNYRDRLEYTHPLVNSEKFLVNSYSKTACENIMREIDKSEDLPFDLTPIEILDAFCEKMKNYACMNSKNSFGFLIASDVAEYLIEEFWRQEQKQ